MISKVKWKTEIFCVPDHLSAFFSARSSVVGSQGVKYDLEPALDRLAEVVRREMDIDRVYRLLGM